LATKIQVPWQRKNFSPWLFPDISSKQARLDRDEAKRLIQSNIDPVQDRQEKKLKRLEFSNNSFEVVACEWVDEKRNEWSEGHTHRVLTSLEKGLLQ